MMRHFIGAATLALGLSGAVTGAQANGSDPVVVELFTSQGCSSCPPADEVLAQLAARDDIIALSLHVDYWDYIGWVDKFAKPAFTLRQKAYAAAHGTRMVYTPQMVINGQSDVVGHKAMKVMEIIAGHQAQPARVSIDVTSQDGMNVIRLEPMAAPLPDLNVQLIRFRPEATVQITRGENAGRTLTYRNIVTDITPLTSWDGTSAVTLNVPVNGPESAVVLIQQTGHRAILAAARLR